MNGYKKYNSQKEQVSGWLENASSWFEELQLHAECEKLQKLKTKLNNDVFKVMVVGEFKRGKSTFINAMLGSKILPAYSTPCTAVINEVKYGPEEKAKLYFRSPLPNVDGRELPLEIKQHLDKYKGLENILPWELPDPFNLESYVVIKEDEMDEVNESVADSIYAYAELQWPIPLCRSGVEIVDSPGLNEKSTRTRITSDYLKNADAIIFVMSCSQFFSNSEKEFIENDLKIFGKQNVFYICNRFDQVDDDDRERIIKYAKTKLQTYTNREPSAYFLASSKALKGRTTGNNDLVVESGIVNLEKDLESFLTFERGTAKLRMLLVELDEVSINRLRHHYIPQTRQHMLDLAENLKEKLDKAKSELENARTDAQQTKRKICLKREGLERILEDQLKIFKDDVLKNIPDWMNEWDTNNKWDKKIKLLSTNHKSQAKDIMAEVFDKISQRLEEKQCNWNEETLTPLIQKEFEDIANIIEEKGKDFQKNIEYARASFIPEQVKTDNYNEPETGERVVAGVGGFLIGGIGAGLIGGTLGMKEMIKGLVPQVALVMGLTIFGAFNPFILIPTLLGAGTLQALFQGEKVEEKIRAKAADAFCKEINSKMMEQKDQMIAKIVGEVDKISIELEEEFNKGIEIVEDEMKQAYNACNKNQLEKITLEEKLKLIDESAKELHDEISQFIVNIGTVI